MSEDDRWSDVIHQVLGALHEANVDDPETREALADGVRQALESLGTDMDLNIQIMGNDVFSEGPPPMDVEVMDGGRLPDSPPTEGKKPSLRIADPGEEDDVDTGANPTTVQPYVTQVKVLQGSPFTAPGDPPPRRRPQPLWQRRAAARVKRTRFDGPSFQMPFDSVVYSSYYVQRLRRQDR